MMREFVLLMLLNCFDKKKFFSESDFNIRSHHVNINGTTPCLLGRKQENHNYKSYAIRSDVIKILGFGLGNGSAKAQ